MAVGSGLGDTANLISQLLDSPPNSPPPPNVPRFGVAGSPLTRVAIVDVRAAGGFKAAISQSILTHCTDGGANTECATRKTEHPV